MSRPWLLIFIVFLVMITSQFEWKQQFGEEIEPTPTVSIEDQSVSKRHEYVKEKEPKNIRDCLTLLEDHSPAQSITKDALTMFKSLGHFDEDSNPLMCAWMHY